MDTADAAGPSTNTSGGNIWDHAWTLDEIKKNAGNWSLAADVGLLKHMDEFSKRLTSRAHEVSSDVSQLVHDTRLTDCNIQSVTDYFLALSDSQFIENRVYDEDDSGSKDAKETTEPKEKTREEKEAEMLPRLKEALKYGLDVIEESYDVLDIKAGDSDIDSDDEEDLTPGELILEAKDPYVVRPLPHLIGSRAFYQDDDVGVGDLLGSDDVESEVGSLSESEDEIEKPASVSDVSTSEYSDDDMSDGGDGDAEVIPVKRRQTVSSDDVTSSDDEDLFDKPASDDSDDEEVQAKPRAESSISKSKPKPAKKKKQPEQDLFGQDEDAEDDLFAPTSGLFGGGKKSLFDAPSDGGLFEGADASFEDTTDESSEDDDTQQEVAPKPQEAKKSQKKLPTGGVSLFGGAIKKGFFHHGDASDESDASEEETPPKLDAPPQAKSSGGLFDQSDSDEDLFDEVQPKKKETPPVKRTPISTKSSPQIAAKPPVKSSLFDESDDDADDDEDLFKEAETEEKPKEVKSKKPVGGVSMFGAGGGGLQEALKKRRKDSSSTSESGSDEDDGLFSSKPPPVPSDDRDASKKSSAEKVTKGDGGLFKVSDSEDDDLFSNFKKPKKVIKPTVAPAKKPKEATAPPKSTTVSKTKQSGLFGSDSDDGDDGDLFSKPPPFTSKTGAAKKSAAASLFDDDDSDQAVADVKPAKKPAAKKALATSLFDDDDDDGDDAALDVKREEKSSEQKPTSDPLYGDDDSKDGDALDAVEDTKVEAPPQEEAPKKRLPGAVSMFGAGGNELLAAIQKKRSASQKSTSAPPVEAVSPPLDDAVNGTERSDKDVDAAGREATPKPTNLFEKTATKTANVTAKPFKPSSALSESKPIVSKVAAPNVTSGSSIGKLKTNLAINPAALLPGSAPIIKSSVDVDAPLESATKTRSRGQAGRRPPSRRARQKIAERASEEILSTSPFDDVSTNKPSQPAGKPHEVASKAKESNNDDFLDQLLSTSTAKSSKETSKSPQTKKKEPAKAPSLFGDDDDLFSAPSTVAKTTATKKNNLFDDSVSAADDLFDMAPKSTAGPRAKATPGGDDLFGDSPKASDSASKNSAKKIDLFGNDLFADGDDDLDFMKSPIAKSQRGDKTSAEAKKKKKTDLFADGDLFADDITFSKPTKKKTQPSKAPKDDFDDLFGDSSPTVTKKKSKKQASKQKTDDLFGGDDDDIFAASLSSSKKKTVKSSTKVDTGLDDVDDLFSSVPSSKKSTSKSKAKTSEPTDTDIFDDPLNALMS